MKNFRILLVMAAVLTAVGFVSAQTWTQTGAPTNLPWSAIASSADGTTLVAAASPGPIYTSTNGGLTWTEADLPSTNVWTAVASSADGTKLVADADWGPIYISTNAGLTWNARATNTSPSYGWSAIASSADGARLIAVMLSRVYFSTNSGMSWYTNIPDIEALGVASSADWTKLVAMGCRLHLSTNSGATWTYSIMPYYGGGCDSIASSADGNKLVAGVGEYLFTSKDSGESWTASNTNYGGNWRSIASSADGNILVAMGCRLHLSTNSGTTWDLAIPLSSPLFCKDWNCVASSADGSKLIAAIHGGGIYTWKTTPSPQLNLTPSGGNLTTSWIIPSTNFVLQQSADLSSWTDVTNPPALNLTNLQDEIFLSPTNGSSFYRLKTP